jgi:hypothetical protein
MQISYDFLFKFYIIYVYYLYKNIFMITKEKNVALNLSIPKDLKEEFVRFAYDLWTIQQIF